MSHARSKAAKAPSTVPKIVQKILRKRFDLERPNLVRNISGVGACFQGISHAHILRGPGPSVHKYLGPPMCAKLRNNDQIVHGDQTRCEEYFYRVDHKC